MMRFVRRAPSTDQAEVVEAPTKLPKPLPTRSPRVILVAQLIMELADDKASAVPIAVQNWARLATGNEVES